jgi:hypothetical protein
LIAPALELMRIFISYANEDEGAALRIYGDLRSNGHDPWIACRDILPGQDWEAEIRRAIEGCRFFIAVLSTTSVGKVGYVQREVRMASEIIDKMPPERVFVIPVRLDNCEVPYERIRGRQWQNLFPSYEEGIKRVFQVLSLSDETSSAIVGGA